jgi:SsrA-binding protein
VPLSIYFLKGWVKVELGLSKGKKKVDKRQAIKERDLKRDLDQQKKKRDY